MSESKKDSQKQPFYKKWWFWAIIIVVVIVAGVAAAGNNEPQKVGEGESSESTNKDENTTFKVGDVVKIGDYEVTVSKIERDYKSTNQFVKPGDGKEFVRVHVEVKNTSNDKKDYNYINWQLEDADGALESAAVAAYTADESGLGYGELTAGGKKAGTLIFEVPKGQSGLKLHYKPTLSFDNKEVVIEL